MSYSYTDTSGNGALTQFTVPFPYLDKAHVTVTVGGTLVPFTWLNDTTVVTASAPITGTNNVRILRTTPIATLRQTFVDGSTLTQDQLNQQNKQTLYAIQEENDTFSLSKPLPAPIANQIIGWDPTGTFLVTISPGSVPLAIPASSSVDQSKLAADVQYRVDTVPTLKALTTKFNSVLVLGYNTIGDGGGGVFFWNNSDARADNGGTIIQPNTGGGRWNRLNPKELDVKYFGAKADGTIDDTTAVAQALAASGKLTPIVLDRVAKTGASYRDNNPLTDRIELMSKGGRVSLGAMPNLIRALHDYRTDIPAAIQIVGLGSSVGNGATLASPTVDAPPYYFSTRLQNRANRAGIYSFATYQRSANGTTVFQGDTIAWPALLAEPLTPKVVLICFGMNDGQAAQFNSGQGFPACYNNMRSLCMKIRAAGADPIICTTPHPHSTRNSFSIFSLSIPATYPTSITAPVADAALIPTVATSTITNDVLNNGKSIPYSHRHLRANEAYRRVAVELGVALIDVERYWFEAVGMYGEDALFGAAEYVHPNLLGHQLSYQRAIDDFIAAAFDPGLFETNAGALAGRIGINVISPTAGLEVYPQDATDSSVKLRAQSGTLALEVANDGTVKTHLAPNMWRPWSERKYFASNTAFSLQTAQDLYNIGAASPISIAIPDGTMCLKVFGFQAGIGRQTSLVYYTGNGSAVLSTTSIFSAGPGVYTLSSAGASVIITPVASNTNIRYVVENY